MSIHSYPVEVQSDFLEKITRSKPVQALAEFIWNSLDADASRVDVFFEDNDLGVMSRIIVRDNGTGIDHRKAPEMFGSLGGSWKKFATSTTEGRFLHGQDGRGRFKAFSMGAAADWEVTYAKDGALSTFMINMSASRLKEVGISDEEPAADGKPRGVMLTISELHRDFRSLHSEAGIQELTEMFALYLADYEHVNITIAGTKIDPSRFIASKGSVNLPDIVEDGKSYPARLDIIEWKSPSRLPASRFTIIAQCEAMPMRRLSAR